MQYDAAGNLTNDTYTGAGNRTYDGENKITSAWGGNNQAQLYAYDVSGQRIKRTVDGVETWQVYGLDGELLAEYAANAAATSPQKEYGYRNDQLLVTATSGARLNVAASANGGTATASETHSAPYVPAGAINGDRKYYLNNNAWSNSTATFPQWFQVDFNGSKVIDEIDVFSVQNLYNTPSEPTPTMTFNTYGLTTFQAQYWNGSSWVTVPNGSVSGNNLVWKQITFSPITTTKIRLWITGSSDGYSRLTEIEAWGTPAGSGPSSTIQWLVADQLGTPRIIFDQTGDLANMKRHDYLPFGEELFPPAGGRSTAMGYSGGDGVRQQFTSKERDIETGLDYFLARYYSSVQGRFISPDEFSGGPDEYYEFTDVASDNPTFYADLTDPQSLNKYQYAYNNPLLYIDPDGHQGIRERFRQAVNKAADFVDGVGKGINSSITFGASGAPQPSDTLLNRAGQGVGTVATAVAGVGLIKGGIAITGVSGGTAAVAGVGVAATGAYALVGATANAIRISQTPMERRASSGPTPDKQPNPVSGSRGGPGAGKQASPATKTAVRTRDNNRCVYCGKRTTSKAGARQSNIDHSVPKSRGGNNTMKNLQNTCRRCNQEKGAKTNKEYLKWKKDD